MLSLTLLIKNLVLTEQKSIFTSFHTQKVKKHLTFESHILHFEKGLCIQYKVILVYLLENLQIKVQCYFGYCWVEEFLQSKHVTDVIINC